MQIKKRMCIALVGALFVGVLAISAPVRASAADATATSLARIEGRLVAIDSGLKTLAGLTGTIGTDLKELDKFTRAFYDVEKNRYAYYVRLHNETKNAANSAVAQGKKAVDQVNTLSAAQAARYGDFVDRYNTVVKKLNENADSQNAYAELASTRYSDLADRQITVSRQVSDVSSAVTASTNRVIQYLNSLDLSAAGSVSPEQMKALNGIQSGLVSSAKDCYESGKSGDTPWWSLTAPVAATPRPCSRIDDVGRGIGELLKQLEERRKAIEQQREMERILRERADAQERAEANDRALEQAEKAQKEAKEAADKAQKTREQVVRELQKLGEGIASGFKEVGEGLNGIAEKMKGDGSGAGDGGNSGSGSGPPDVKGFGSGIGQRVNDWGSIPQCLAVKPGSACKAFPIKLFGTTYHVVNICPFNLDAVHRWRDVVGAVMLVMVAWAGGRWIIAAIGVNVPSEGR